MSSGGSGTAVTAMPNTGYHFVNWSDASAANPRTDTGVTADITVTASFAINTYTLTYTAGANGTITGSSPQTVNHGASGTAVTAVPATNYHFVNWSDGSTANPRTDTNVTANMTVTASFALNTYTLTYTAGANGSIVGTSPQTVNHGASGTLVTATPTTGYHFVSWSDGYPTAARTDTNVTANITATASFAINTYTLTYTAGANGSITGTSPQTVNHGASGTAVTAVANAGYHFVSWSGGSTANPRTDTNVTANLSVTATFAINTYTLTYTAGANGTISGDQPADRQPRGERHGGNSGAQHRLSLRELERRRSYGEPHRRQRDRQHHGQRRLRHQHLHSHLYGRSQWHHHRRQPADGEPWLERHGGNSGAQRRISLRDLE